MEQKTQPGHALLADWLNAKRANEGVAAAHIARQIGVTPETLSLWKANKRNPSGSARKMLEAYSGGAVPSGVDWG